MLGLEVIFACLGCFSFFLFSTVNTSYLGTIRKNHIYFLKHGESHWIGIKDCVNRLMKVKVKVTQSSLSLCYPMDYSPPGSSVHRNCPGRNTGVGCHFFLQEIFPAQGSNPGFPPCRWILYGLSHQGSN